MMMNKTKAFFGGMLDFRSSFTLNFTDGDELMWHDMGREFAHRITFRRYEQE